MKIRSLATCVSVPVLLLTVIAILHRQVADLAPALPVTVSSEPLPQVNPIPLPSMEPPTVLESQPDDGLAPLELQDAIARRPDSDDDLRSAIRSEANEPLPLPTEPLLLPIPELNP